MTRSLRIAVIVSQFPSLSQTFVSDHVNSLIERGHDVRVFSRPSDVEPQPNLMGKINYWPVKPPEAVSHLLPSYLRVQWNLLNQGKPLMAPTMPAMIRSETVCSRANTLAAAFPVPDIIHAHFAYVGESVAQVRQWTRMRTGKLVATVHGVDILSTTTNTDKARRYPALFKEAESIFATTKFLAERTRQLGAPNGRIVQRPLGIRTSEFPYTPRVIPSAEAVNVLTVGRLVEKKGVEYGIRAVALAIKGGANLHYHIVGGGPMHPSLQSLSHLLGIDQHVTFHLAQPRPVVQQLLNEAHLLLMPSVTASNGDMEGQGMVALEAQASGLPVIASRHGGIPEILHPSNHRWLCEERDVNKLAESITKLVAGNEYWLSTAQKVSRWVQETHDHERYMDFLESEYFELVEGAS